jgi:hypothetical protein
MAKQTAEKSPFWTVFNAKDGKEAKIKQIQTAVELLREMLDKPENPRQASLWAQALIPFSGDQLAEAFNACALTSKGWPTLGDITEPIFAAEFAADLAWLLQRLKLHKPEWRDRPAIFGPDYRKPGAGIDEWTKGPETHAAVPAPPIPPRLVRALQVLGAGTELDGLTELARHPGAGGVIADSVESGKARFQVERDFRAAWMMARREELAAWRPTQRFS